MNPDIQKLRQRLRKSEQSLGSQRGKTRDPVIVDVLPREIEEVNLRVMMDERLAVPADHGDHRCSNRLRTLGPHRAGETATSPNKQAHIGTHPRSSNATSVIDTRHH